MENSHIPGISDGAIFNITNQIIRDTATIITKANITQGLLVMMVIIGVIILLNQRKIRKELRQLREMMENQDKPNGEI